jgi:hypothetical protein
MKKQIMYMIKCGLDSKLCTILDMYNHCFFKEVQEYLMKIDNKEIFDRPDSKKVAMKKEVYKGIGLSDDDYSDITVGKLQEMFLSSEEEERRGHSDTPYSPPVSELPLSKQKSESGEGEGE